MKNKRVKIINRYIKSKLKHTEENYSSYTKIEKPISDIPLSCQSPVDQ